MLSQPRCPSSQPTKPTTGAKVLKETATTATTTTTITAILQPLTGQPALAGSPAPRSEEPEDFVGTKIYCPHALADCN